MKGVYTISYILIALLAVSAVFIKMNIYERKTLAQALILPRKKQCDLVYIEVLSQTNDTVALQSYSIHKGK